MNTVAINKSHQKLLTPIVGVLYERQPKVEGSELAVLAKLNKSLQCTFIQTVKDIIMLNSWLGWVRVGFNLGFFSVVF